MPIYVAGDSADVWADPGQFYLDEELNPIDVAGCPPDAFSADGQLWGNPLFRWDAMKKDGYSWWTKRVKAMSKLYDIVRIDHFRGFDSYYAIPAKDDTARNGEWRKGPGMDLFRTMEKKTRKVKYHRGGSWFPYTFRFKTGKRFRIPGNESHPVRI